MAEARVLDEDLVRVYAAEESRRGVVFIFYWGEDVTLVDPSQADDPSVREVQVRLWSPAFAREETGVIRKRSKRSGVYHPIKFRERHLLEVTCIDVQQGDATLVRMPNRKLLLVDGGEEAFVARMLAAWFPHTSAEAPLKLDAVVITHGDADHFSGLVELDRARSDTRATARIHTRMLRVYHSGLVKRAGAHGEAESFGAHEEFQGREYATELLDDPRHATEPNKAFRAWNEALDRLLEGADGEGPELPVVRRLSHGDHAAFDVFRPEVDIRVLAPLTDGVSGRPALPFLNDARGSKSASHTINGHSVILQLTYGNLHCLLGGDLNVDGAARLLARVTPAELRAEVFKVPHHGSHEFDPAFLGAVSPVVSVVSSGDESAFKEYVHPRANLLAALGRASRGPEPLIFCTELAAFFAYRGLIHPEQHDSSATGVISQKPEQIPPFYAFERKVFGRVRIRSDGERVLVAVESASDSIKEAYAFRVDASGAISRDECSML